MSSTGRKELMVAGVVEEGFVEGLLMPVDVVVVAGLWALDEEVPVPVPVLLVKIEVYGRLKSSKRSARRGWWKWMWFGEESLDWFWFLCVSCLFLFLFLF